MYIAKPRSAAKRSKKKRGITDMLRKRKLNKKCLTETKRQRRCGRQEIKNRSNKLEIVTNRVNINPTVSDNHLECQSSKCTNQLKGLLLLLLLSRFSRVRLQRPHGLQPTRLLRPWDFPGKSTGVGCHCWSVSKNTAQLCVVYNRLTLSTYTNID